MRTRPSAVRPGERLSYTVNRRLDMRTGERKTDVVIQHDNLAHSSWVLQLENGLLFDTKNYNIFAHYTDLFATAISM